MDEQLSLFELEDTCDFSKSEGEGMTCAACKEYKPLTSFPFETSARNYRKSRCRKCFNHLNKVRRALKKTPYPLKDYLCPICKRTEKEVQRRWTNKGAWGADHCHTTHKFRGWICHSCNIALGMFKDNIDTLKRSITYLEKT